MTWDDRCPTSSSLLWGRISEHGELKNCKGRTRRDPGDGEADKAATHWFETVELDRGNVIVGRAIYHGPELLAIERGFKAIAIGPRRTGWLIEPLPGVAVDMDLPCGKMRGGVEDDPAGIDHELLIRVVGIARAEVKHEPGLGVAFGRLPPRAHIIVEGVLRISSRSGAAG